MSGAPPATARRKKRSFARYLRDWLVAERGFSPGVPEEAAELALEGRFALMQNNFGLLLVVVVDRERDPERRFELSLAEVVEIGRRCLPRAGRTGFQRLNVGVTIYEVGRGPPSSADRRRLGRLLRRIPGFAGVQVTAFYLDVAERRIWTNAPLGGWLRERRQLERLIQNPRRRRTELDRARDEVVGVGGTRKSAITYALLGALLFVFAVEHWLSVGPPGAGFFAPGLQTLVSLGALNRALVLEHGEWHRLLSAVLLHADAFHLLLNLAPLWLAGVVLEDLLGRGWLLSLFLAGALGGSLFGLVSNPANAVSVGASGAVLGLLAAGVVVSYRLRPGAERTALQLVLGQSLIPSLIPLATHKLAGNVDYAAHAGGALAGALGGALLLRSWPRGQKLPGSAIAAKTAGLLSVAAFVVSLLLVAHGYFARPATSNATSTAAERPASGPAAP
jgi:rhomboid protease GluP